MPQRTANNADNRASFIDFTTGRRSHRLGGSEAICGKRGDTIGQSCFGDESFSNPVRCSADR